MNIYKVLTSLITVLSVGMLNAQIKSGDTPSLVVAISVDQLRGDYVDLFLKSLGDKGLKKMMAEGTVYLDVDYDLANLNLASSLATIYTGVTPNIHSIIASRYYNSDFLQSEAVFYDRNYTSSFSLEALSPLAIKSNTITDQLKKASADVSKVYALSPESTVAMILAGKLGNAGYWVDDNSGKWSTSSYYTYYTPIIDQVNGGSNSYSNQIWNTQWKPLKTTSVYPYTKVDGGFTHNLASDPKPIVLSKKTPFINEYIVTTAIKLLEKNGLGKNLTPDFLSIQLYAGNYDNSTSYEIEDIYLRLDKEIEKLIQAVETNVGIQNTLFLLYSTGYYVDSDLDSDNVFFVDRNVALLNMYLTAKYGQGQSWVDDISDSQVHLNKKSIANNNINVSEIRRDVANFMSDLSGVSAAYSKEQIFDEERHKEWKNSLFKKKSGDVILEFTPGCVIKNTQTDTRPLDIYQKVSCPIVFYGYNIKSQNLNRTINATDIAPALATILRIRPPSSNAKNKLFELNNIEQNKK